MKIIMLGIIPLLLLVTPAMANAQTWTYYNSSSGESGQITITTANANQEFKDIHGNTIHI